MSDQDTHRDREVTLVISDVAVKGFHNVHSLLKLETNFSEEREEGFAANAFERIIVDIFFTYRGI